MKKNGCGIVLLCCAVLAASVAQSAHAATTEKKSVFNNHGNNDIKNDKVITGELYVEPPTLLSLGFEWNISGDDNHNASVAVSYRKKGERDWREALPLRRLQHEMFNGNPPEVDYIAPNMFAGSILDLEPDTTYEARFLMTDPDGVVGAKDYRYVTVHTRAEPKPFAGGRVLHVYPAGYAGVKQEPAFTDLMSVYEPNKPIYRAQHNGVEPGDIILVHAGTYSMLPSDAPTYLLNRSGTADKPIVIKSAGDGEVIFDGQNSPVLFNMMGGNYNYLEGLTLRNAGIGILAGEKKIGGATGLTIKNCRIENVGNGIWAMYAGSKNFYIADNVILGRQKKDGLVGGTPAGVPTQTFWKSAPGYPALQYTSNNGIHLYGSGHVVAYNEIAYFWDGINTSFYNELPSSNRDLQPVSNDFYNNYIHTIADNNTSVEEQMHNARLFRNLLIDDAGSGPVGLTHNWGGPMYVYRNIVYHVPNAGTLKLPAATGGVLIYNNTFFTEVQFGSRTRGVSNMDFKNNLVLGEESTGKVPGKVRPNFAGVYYWASYTSYSASDYNGYRPNPGASPQFVLAAPASGLQDYLKPLVEQEFDTLAQLCAATGQECHGKLVDFDLFQNVSQPDPNQPTRLYPRESLDFRLKPGAVAIDAGYSLPNITDGFTGAAPDLGALEFGQPVPHYGPRTAARSGEK